MTALGGTGGNVAGKSSSSCILGDERFLKSGLEGGVVSGDVSSDDCPEKDDSDGAVDDIAEVIDSDIFEESLDIWEGSFRELSGARWSSSLTAM